jgi:hypothetical protein
VKYVIDTKSHKGSTVYSMDNLGIAIQLGKNIWAVMKSTERLRRVSPRCFVPNER